MSIPEVVCKQFYDNAELVRLGGIHKNLSPFGLRFFLAQERMFLSRRIHRYAFVQKFFLSFQKSFATRQMRIFRGSLFCFYYDSSASRFHGDY